MLEHKVASPVDVVAGRRPAHLTLHEAALYLALEILVLRPHPPEGPLMIPRQRRARSLPTAVLVDMLLEPSNHAPFRINRLHPPPPLTTLRAFRHFGFLRKAGLCARHPLGAFLDLHINPTGELIRLTLHNSTDVTHLLARLPPMRVTATHQGITTSPRLSQSRTDPLLNRLGRVLQHSFLPPIRIPATHGKRIRIPAAYGRRIHIRTTPLHRGQAHAHRLGATPWLPLSMASRALAFRLSVPTGM